MESHNNFFKILKKKILYIDNLLKRNFSGALNRHDGSALDAFATGQAPDAQDGQKILGHVFGAQQGQAAQAVGKRAGINPQLAMQIMSMLAPLVLAYLSRQRQGGAAGGAANSGGGISGGPDLGSILGGLVGGGGLCPPATPVPPATSPCPSAPRGFGLPTFAVPCRSPPLIRLARDMSLNDGL